MVDSGPEPRSSRVEQGQVRAAPEGEQARPAAAPAAASVSGDAQQLQRLLALVSTAQRSASVLQLQALHGNQAVQRILAPAAPDRSPTTSSIATWSTAQKLEAAIRSAPVGEQLRDRLDELLTPQSLATMTAFVTVFVAAQLTPAGWVSDLVAGGLVVASAVMIGPEVVDIVQHLAAFVSEAASATSKSDIDRAGNDFAVAVTKLGVDVVTAILLHKAVKAAGSIEAPPTQKFAAAVTPDGQVVQVPYEELPDTASQMKATNPSESSERPSTTPVAPVARQISTGHAFGKHVVKLGEFPEIDGPDLASRQAQFAKIINDVMQSPVNKSLANGRHAYWDQPTGTVVITNPNAADGGTCFRPTTGSAYYDGLK